MDNKNNTKKKKNINALLFVLSIVLWCAIVYFSFNYSKSYIDTSINQVSSRNTDSIESLSNDVDTLKEKIETLNLDINSLNLDNEALTAENRAIGEGLQQLNEDIESIKSSLGDVLEQIQLSSNNQENLGKVLNVLKADLDKLDKSIGNLEVMPSE